VDPNERNEPTQTKEAAGPGKPKYPENSVESRCEELKLEAENISQKEQNKLRWTTIPEAKEALQIAKTRLQNVREAAPMQITLPIWVKMAERLTPQGLGLAIGDIVGNVIVGKMNEERRLKHEEQVSLWEKYVERVKRGIEQLEAKDRMLSDRLQEINLETQKLNCGQQKKRRPIV
jgi:hypothetical protein